MLVLALDDLRCGAHVGLFRAFLCSSLRFEGEFVTKLEAQLSKLFAASLGKMLQGEVEISTMADLGRRESGFVLTCEDVEVEVVARSIS